MIPFRNMQLICKNKKNKKILATESTRYETSTFQIGIVLNQLCKNMQLHKNPGLKLSPSHELNYIFALRFFHLHRTKRKSCLDRLQKTPGLFKKPTQFMSSRPNTNRTFSKTRNRRRRDDVRTRHSYRATQHAPIAHTVNNIVIYERANTCAYHGTLYPRDGVIIIFVPSSIKKQTGYLTGRIVTNNKRFGRQSRQDAVLTAEPQIHRSVNLRQTHA